MATEVAEKRVYRSRDAYVGGVCAGLAERFDMDVIVVRILAVLLAGMSLGLAIVPYIVLWARLPLKPAGPALYEVQPESAESTSFGSVDCVTGRAVADERSPLVNRVPIVARLAVAVCLVVLFLVVSTNISPLMPGTEWWQFWPLGLLMVGLFLIIVPIPTRHEAVWHALGIVVTACAATVLPMSLGVLSWDTLPYALDQAGLIFAIAVVLFGLGVYRENSAIMVAAAFVFVAFCLVALTLCTVPGDVETLMLYMPDGREIRISFIGA